MPTDSSVTGTNSSVTGTDFDVISAYSDAKFYRDTLELAVRTQKLR